MGTQDNPTSELHDEEIPSRRITSRCPPSPESQSEHRELLADLDQALEVARRSMARLRVGTPER
ncbi:MAG: hypothetical protein IPF92_29265 [Myxococcales bacterium]|jgi:hypothetical protein|nr:hypothetical protein [Myxococcales bacterium]MBL0196768.1 hypothetical protein [Myxococcales bacterium]HQY60535.1 hypothetical protein [Polyangiaceae bacterium]